METELTDIKNKFTRLINSEFNSLDFQNELQKLDTKSQLKFINNSFIESVRTFNFTALKYLIENHHRKLLKSKILYELNNLRNSKYTKIRELIVNQKYGITEAPILFIAIAEENLEIVKYLLEEYKVDVNECDSNNDSALHKAVEKRNSTIITLLLQVDTINPLLKNDDHKTPLDLAIQNNDTHIINMLNTEFQKKHLCFLMLKTRNTESLKKLISEKYYDLDYKDTSGNTLLHEAVKRNDIEVIKYLISLPEIKALEKNFDNKTPFDLARDNNNNKVINLMTKNKYGKIKRSLLILATINSESTLINHLIKTDSANIAYEDIEGNNAIHHAVLNNEICILSLLLKIPNANPLKFNLDGKTALSIAKEEKNNEALDIIINAQYVDEDHRELSILQIAIRNQQLDLLKYLLETQEKTLTSVDKSKNLVIASQQNNRETIEHLIKTRNAKYLASQPLPLNISAKHGFVENCHTILKHFPHTINFTNHHNKHTALMEAIRNNHLGVLEILLKQSKIEINKNFELHLAVHMKNKAMVEKLMNHPKTDIFKKNSQKKTVFDIAAEQNIIVNTRINEALLKKQHSIKKNSLLLITIIISGFILLSLNVKNLIENSKYNKNAITQEILTALIILALISASAIYYIETKKEIQRTVKTIFLQNLNIISSREEEKESYSSDDHSSSLESVSLCSNNSRKDSIDSQILARRKSSILETAERLCMNIISQKQA